MIRLLALLLLIAPRVLPCSCGTQRPCGNVARSAVVFTGLTISGGDGWKSPSARFKVIRAFKGVHAGDLVDVDTASQTSCAATFQVGQEYLVFAHNNGGHLGTTLCGGSRQVAKAVEELRYLEAWEKGQTRTEIVGYVMPNIRGSDHDWERAYVQMVGAKVHIVAEDGKVVQTAAGKQGDFSVPVAGPGRYEVSVDLPKWVSEEATQTVVVPAAGCGEVGFQLRPDGQVLGRAVNPDGAGAKDVLLKLVSVLDFGITVETRTDQLGRFRFRGVPAGAYRLGVNADSMDDPSQKVPYASTFYPGVGDERSARVIRVGEFGKVQLESVFQLPPILKPVTIRVRVTLGNGQPIRGASVSCTPEGHSYWRKVSTDSQGFVDFAVMGQIPYIVDVDIPSNHELAKAGYKRSRWIRISPRAGINEVQVTLGNTASGKQK